MRRRVCLTIGAVLSRKTAIHKGSKSELTEFRDVETLSEGSFHLEQVAEKQRLERRLMDLDGRLRRGRATSRATDDLRRTILSGSR
jgi:hypothetical protein